MKKNTSSFHIEEDEKAFYSSFPAAGRQPVIGISGNFREGECCLAEGYYISVLRAGGTPLVIPPYKEEEALYNLLPHIDGLLLTGGGDINPLYMGEEPVKELHGINARRDRQELLLARWAAYRQIPILGICRGIQILNAAFGGKNYQDIYTQFAQPCIKHSQDLERGVASHHVEIVPGTTLQTLFPDRSFVAVNSFHHQAVRETAAGFRVAALSSDHIIEAMESTEYKSVIGVQWHPECFVLNGDESMMPLFRWLIGEALSFNRAKQIHRLIPTLDSHCDTPMFFDQGICFGVRDSRLCVDLHKMNEGLLDGCIMVAYLKQLERDESALKEATRKADRILSEIEAMAGEYADHIEIAYTPADLLRLKKTGKKAIFLGIENGYAIGKDLSLIEHFRKHGVVYMTLCHNGDNDLCDSAKGQREHGGLSELGRRAIREMNRTGMMVDLSHASEESFYQALKQSRLPIVCTHSSCRALCDHTRNLTDEQIRALAVAGGVIQITLYGGFLRKEGEAALPDAVRHILHAVQVGGIEHVGIGSDFDGDGGIKGCANAAELPNLTRALLAEGFTLDDMEKLWGGNFLRVMEQVQQEKG